MSEKWIPTSKNFPKTTGEYLVTWKTSATNRPLMQILEYNAEAEEWCYESYMSNYPNVEIIAWMELPIPYTGQNLFPIKC